MGSDEVSNKKSEGNNENVAKKARPLPHKEKEPLQ